MSPKILVALDAGDRPTVRSDRGQNESPRLQPEMAGGTMAFIQGICAESQATKRKAFIAPTAISGVNFWVDGSHEGSGPKRHVPHSAHDHRVISENARDMTSTKHP